jgi:rhodanese-related sulfurtransferase
MKGACLRDGTAFSFPPAEVQNLLYPSMRVGTKSQEVKSMSISKEGVKDKMKDMNCVVLNVLPEADYAKLHIKGSESFPLTQKMDEFVLGVEKKYGKSKFFITYCAGPTCNAGPNAAKALKEKGFKAEDYTGGMSDWSDADLPTEGTQAKVQAPVAAGK